MNKDEILRRNRVDNQAGDEREQQLHRASGIPLLIAFGVASCALMILEMLFLDTKLLLHSLGLIASFMVCVQFWYLVAVIRKKLYIATAVCFTFSTILNIFMFADTFRSMM